jgi:hypothetical protein
MDFKEILKGAVERKRNNPNHRIVGGTKRARQLLAQHNSNQGNLVGTKQSSGATSAGDSGSGRVNSTPDI